MSKAVSSALWWKHPLRLLAAIGEDLIWCKASSMDATTLLSLMIGTPAWRAANERCTSTTIYRRPEASERKMGDHMGDQKYLDTKKPRKIRALMKNSGGSVEIRTLSGHPRLKTRIKTTSTAQTTRRLGWLIETAAEQFRRFLR
ncbi:protein of unknown function [Pseudomonas sp. JV551A1]|uniref:Uncharacterized protein n=1 Tax=Pseudomonas inefficax TaxID=2078786 RepID=A0AAQ1PA75_9PSED|nr:protein of unknown function [Pseudomonas sp. JV551A1]SPO62121.1 protein of unknown function [Pseudomonas inefficax]